jgi:nucleotide-binding universal stress UspA family protein
MANQKFSEARVIWAIDPFEEQSEKQRSAALAIQAMIQRQPACVEPVYIASDPKHQVPPRLRESYNRELAAEAQDEVDSWISELKVRKIAGLKPVHVLGPTGASLREQVQSLLQYAHNEAADLIVASTRARRGPSRWFFGSFVETLSLVSDIPVLVVNPLWNVQEFRRKRGAKRPTLRSTQKPAKLSRQFDRILFPTDFSEASHEAFQQLLTFASRTKSEVTVFHKITLGLSLMPEAALSMVAITEEAREAELEMSRRNAETWIREATHKGVHAAAIVDFRDGDSVASAILKEAKRMRCLIALAGESNPFQARLLGSVTRQILRESTEPVWVIHPRISEAERRRAA